MQRANVLIADVEGPARFQLGSLLVELGHTIIGEAETNEQVLAMARSLRPDAVILDSGLPRASGIDVARALFSERIAPVIATSSGTDLECADRAVAAGALAFLAKPLRPQELRPAIDIAIARFHEIVTLEKEVRSLQDQMEARKLVGRAKAILMERNGLAEREAFHRIQHQSVSLGKPLSEIARAIITANEITHRPEASDHGV